MTTAELLAAADEVLAAITYEPTKHGRSYARVKDATLGLMAQYELARHVREMYDERDIDDTDLKAAGLQNTCGPYWSLTDEENSDWDVVNWSGGWNVRQHGGGINVKSVGQLRRLLALLGGQP